MLYEEFFAGSFDHLSAAAIPIMEDNTGAKALAENYMTSKRSRHFRVRLFYVRDQVRDGVIKIEYIDTHENIADLFTKALLAPKFTKFMNELVHKPMTAPHVGK